MSAPRIWTRERVIAAAQRWHAEHERSPRAAEWPDVGTPSATTVNRLFGRFDVMLRAAGLPLPPRREPRWTRERIAAAIQAWTAQNGRLPTSSDFRSATRATPHRVTVAARYGAWCHALDDAARIGARGSRCSAAADVRDTISRVQRDLIRPDCAQP